jgi:hypothetical protein
MTDLFLTCQRPFCRSDDILLKYFTGSQSSATVQSAQRVCSSLLVWPRAQEKALIINCVQTIKYVTKRKLPR